MKILKVDPKVMTERRTRGEGTYLVGLDILGTVIVFFSAFSLFHDSNLWQFALKENELGLDPH